MPYFIDSSKLERREIAPGITIRTMWGDKLMISIVENAPHAVVPAHTHSEHEQGGIVLQGEFDMMIGGETRRLKPGDAYVIPPGVEHKLTGGDGWALALDVFSPPREEYK